MITSEHKDFLKQVHLFNELSTQQLDDVIQHARIEVLHKDEFLFNQGDGVSHFYLVYSGLIKLFRNSADGQEKVIEIVTPGQTFAEALMFLDCPEFPVSASSLNEAEIISFDSRYFVKMLSESSKTCLLLLGSMSQRIRRLVQEIDDLSVQNGRHRLSTYLLEQAGDGDSFRLSFPKAVLASRLSIQPETFSRIIKQLRLLNVVRVEGSEIEILDRDQLEDYAVI